MKRGENEGIKVSRKGKYLIWSMEGLVLGVLLLVLGSFVFDLVRPLPPTLVLDAPNRKLNLDLKCYALLDETTTTVAAEPLPASTQNANAGAIKVDLEFPGFDQLANAMDQYFQKRSSQSREESLKALERLQAMALKTWQDYSFFPGKHHGQFPSAYKNINVDAAMDNLAKDIELEKLVVREDWYEAALFCKSNPFKYRWESELGFLRKMGVEGYFLILKRGPERYWEKYKRSHRIKRSPSLPKS